MSRPERRKSSLTGASPVAPAVDAGQPASQRTAANSMPSRTDATANEVSANPPRKKYPPKVSFYQDPDDTARLRAAYRHTLAASSDRSLSDFITRVVMTEVERLENQHNGGRPFPSVGAGEIPQGRPVGE